MLCLFISVNECLDSNGGCSHVCTNTPGTFVCECPEYWQLDADLKTCVDVDECDTR